MVDTLDTGLLPRTYFKAPRVPFDFRGVAIAIIGYLVYWSGGLLVSKIFGVEDLPGAFLASVVDVFRGLPFLGDAIADFFYEVFRVQQGPGVYADYTFWQKLVGAIWFFGVWSFFAQAIHRIVSLRIARDEGLSLPEAFKFAVKNWPTVLLVPAIIGGAMAFFYGCNALGGLVTSIPWVGQLFGLIIIPLATISTLLILLIALGGIFGLPLIGAAAAWERNGSLDAISRAFSYIFARPLQFFWNYFLIFLFIGIIMLVGNWFIHTLVKSVDAGAIFDNTLTVIIDAPERDNTDAAWADFTTDERTLYETLEAETGYVPGGMPGRMVHDGLARGPRRPFAMHFKTVLKSPPKQILNAFTFWVVLNLIWFGVFGYAVYWFFGATTSVYADLRADVDGTEEDEIYLEDEVDDFDAFQEAVDSATPETGAGEASEAAAGEKPASSEPVMPPPTPPHTPPDVPKDAPNDAPKDSPEGDSGDPKTGDA